MRCIEIREDRLVFDNGTEVYSQHEQDCCESVYAYFKALEDTTFMEEWFDTLSIEGVYSDGVRINGYFVPCYNTNGYYSSNLTLVIQKLGNELEYIDITEFVST